MLELAGDILNWTAAAVFFPLLFLPLGAALSQKRALFAWALTIGVVVGAGLLLARLTPALRLTPSAEQTGVFFAGVALVAVAIIASGGAQRAMARIATVFESVTRATGRSVMWLLLAMALLQFGVVVLRYVFGLNYIFMQESITYMHGAVFLLAGGYALLTDDHVRVDIFYREASPRRKALVDLAGAYLLLAPVCLLLIWTASPYVARSWLVGEGSNESSGIPALFLLKSCIPAFAILMLMAGFVIAARASKILAERR